MKLKVRVQALGGKFLGDDIGGAVVTVRDSQTGELLVSGRTQGNSGNLSATYAPGASPSALITPTAAGPTVSWLAPDDGTAHLTADLPLGRPRLLEIAALGPLGGLQSAHRVAATEWLVPGQDVDGPLGLVLVMPGLLVQVMQPATHTAIASGTEAVSIAFEASVAMMCGCPISNAANNPWIPDDFDVYADIVPVNAPGFAPARVPLTFNTAGTPSLFTGSFSFIPGAPPAFFEAVITARQKSTGNIGTGTVTFFVKP